MLVCFTRCLIAYVKDVVSETRNDNQNVVSNDNQEVENTDDKDDAETNMVTVDENIEVDNIDAL